MWMRAGAGRCWCTLRPDPFQSNGVAGVSSPSGPAAPVISAPFPLVSTGVMDGGGCLCSTRMSAMCRKPATRPGLMRRFAVGLHIQQQPAGASAGDLGSKQGEAGSNCVVRRVPLATRVMPAMPGSGQLGSRTHAVAHLHAVAHEIARLVAAHARPGHGDAGRGQGVVDGTLVGLWTS